MLIIRAVQSPGVLELGSARRLRSYGVCICERVNRFQVRGVSIAPQLQVCRDAIVVGGERVRQLLEVRLAGRSVADQV